MRILKIVRKIHRTAGITLFIFFLTIAVTGLILGWKKNSNGLILPKSEIGESTDISQWMHISDLQDIAFTALKDSIDKNIDLDLQRIDLRPEKGMVKFVFDNHYWGIQIDGFNGKVLAITKRRSDFFENVHDGSILDIIFGTKGEIIKLIYTSIMGTSLIIFVITGLWLWVGPKILKRSERPGVSRHEFFVLLFLHELPLNHALRVIISKSC